MFLDPVAEVGDLGVDTRVVWTGTAEAPGHDTSETTLDGQWTTGVTLASVLASDSVESSADLSTGNASGILLVGLVAHLDVDYGHGHGLEDGRGTVLGVTPSGDDGVVTGEGLLSDLEQGHGLLGGVELDGFGQTDQGYVVYRDTVAVGVVLVVTDDVLDLVDLSALVPPGGSGTDGVVVVAAADAVSGGQNVVLGYDRAAADVTTTVLDRDLVRVFFDGGVLAAVYSTTAHVDVIFLEGYGVR